MEKKFEKDTMGSVTVIVPVYKVEKFLGTCVDSILHQSFTNISLILIDDGSPDQCGMNCDEYIQIDNRVIVIHAKNCGVSKARNTGLSLCYSDYVTFCDSDDYYEEQWVGNLYFEMVSGKADLISGGMILVDETGNVLFDLFTERRNYYLLNQEARTEFIIKELLQNNFNWSVWSKLFDNQIIQSKNIRFCESCENFAEDMGFVLEYVLYCSKIISCGFTGYYYVQHIHSMMAKSENEIKLNAVNEVSKHFFQRYITCYNSRFSSKVFPVIYYKIFFNQYSKIVYSQRFDCIERETIKIKDKKWFRKNALKALVSYPIFKAYLGKITAREAVLFSSFLVSRSWKLYLLSQHLKKYLGGTHV